MPFNSRNDYRKPHCAPTNGQWHNSWQKHTPRTPAQGSLGFADLILIPRKNAPTPAIIVELKHSGYIILVAISYDKKTKQHQCKI